MAHVTASRSDRLNTYTGRALLWWATTLERTVAGKASREAHKRRRDQLIRAANARGATLDDIVTKTKLRPNTVRAILRKEPTVE
ncbi:hypothetical protein [Streptomyces sp. NBC_00344]|uniref:hypothetical protein n=1 Tax=Streptomyces sp. NBC_00344 TaxID=2975720 RepID=UPI002E1CAF5F